MHYTRKHSKTVNSETSFDEYCRTNTEDLPTNVCPSCDTAVQFDGSLKNPMKYDRYVDHIVECTRQRQRQEGTPGPSGPIEQHASSHPLGLQETRPHQRTSPSDPPSLEHHHYVCPQP